MEEEGGRKCVSHALFTTHSCGLGSRYLRDRLVVLDIFRSSSARLSAIGSYAPVPGYLAHWAPAPHTLHT